MFAEPVAKVRFILRDFIVEKKRQAQSLFLISWFANYIRNKMLLELTLHFDKHLYKQLRPRENSSLSTAYVVTPFRNDLKMEGSIHFHMPQKTSQMKRLSLAHSTQVPFVFFMGQTTWNNQIVQMILTGVLVISCSFVYIVLTLDSLPSHSKYQNIADSL